LSILITNLTSFHQVQTGSNHNLSLYARPSKKTLDFNRQQSWDLIVSCAPSLLYVANHSVTRCKHCKSFEDNTWRGTCDCQCMQYFRFHPQDEQLKRSVPKDVPKVNTYWFNSKYLFYVNTGLIIQCYEVYEKKSGKNHNLIFKLVEFLLVYIIFTNKPLLPTKTEEFKIHAKMSKEIIKQSTSV